MPGLVYNCHMTCHYKDSLSLSFSFEMKYFANIISVFSDGVQFTEGFLDLYRASCSTCYT